MLDSVIAEVQHARGLYANNSRGPQRQQTSERVQSLALRVVRESWTRHVILEKDHLILHWDKRLLYSVTATPEVAVQLAISVGSATCSHS